MLKDKKPRFKKKRGKTKAYEKNYLYPLLLFLFQILLDIVRRNDFLLENVGIGLGRTYHTDNLCKALASRSFECCDDFLCHNLILLYTI